MGMEKMIQLGLVEADETTESKRPKDNSSEIVKRSCGRPRKTPSKKEKSKLGILLFNKIRTLWFSFFESIVHRFGKVLINELPLLITEKIMHKLLNNYV